MISVASTDFQAEARAKKSKTKTTQTTSKSKNSKSKSQKGKNGKKSKTGSKSKNKKSDSSKSKKKKVKSAIRKSHQTSKHRTSTSKWTNHKEAPAEKASSDSLTLLVNNAVLNWVPANLNPGGLRVNLVKPDERNHNIQVKLNDNFTYLPVTNEFINDLQSTVRHSLPDSLKNYRPLLMVGNKSLSYYISKIDKLPVQYRKPTPFVREIDPDGKYAKGMNGDILAMWHSHGRYYKNGSWQWQRPMLFETVEDVYTMSYVLPYIVPMIENAGGYVMLPRERDTNPNEVIVDNDLNEGGEIYSQPYYRETNGTQHWENGEGDGFIYDLEHFRDTENPFEVGTYRQTATINSGKPSVAAWYADIPADGEYAVYVSYKSLPNSTTDARYTVHYSGGIKDFLVNQSMGGGTWIYLGTFPLRKGFSDQIPIVSLTNESKSAAGKILTADAVKIGGGMGNIERSPSRADVAYDPSTPESGYAPQETVQEDEECDDEEDEEVDEENEDEGNDEEVEDALPQNTGEESVDQEETQEPTKHAPAPKKGAAPVFRTSGLPRYLEGARYWLHWAGIPEEVYSPYHGRDDYKDDYTGRALWVNYLAGGSRVLPDEPGLKIPVDAAFALHSDAGRRSDGSTVGTLGIYYTQGGINYEDGTPRINSRMLTDYVMRQITSDIRNTYNSSWTRRSMWDKSYVEARVPEVPTTLIELLSHQNFGDMQYGLDPNFRFLVSRAIYKAIARFMAERKDRDVVIQPLPVQEFAITRNGKGHFKLHWKPTPDPLEPTANPKEYTIYERRGSELGFHKIGTTSSTHYNVKVKDNEIYSFRIVAVNEGGKSFPSETLSCREAPNGGKPVLIVNGFTRVSGPGIVNEGGRLGFDSENDFGVPYIRDISFAGHQRNFSRSSSELGRSDSNYISTIIAGNTFNYPYVHGYSISNAGYGFVSCSVQAVEKGEVNLRDYDVVDLILGKQKESKTGNGQSGWNYKTFPEALQKKIRTFVHHGGDLLVTGEYVASDLYSTRSSQADRDFATQILGVTLSEVEKVRSPRIQPADDARKGGFANRSYSYNNTLNEDMYIVESPDMLQPIGEGEILFDFDGNTGAAGIQRRDGKSTTIVMSIPFESITNVDFRNALMKEILTSFK
ncbi:MAG: xanthan lyase [Prevotella sp.]|nr:xanthan lyase [Prevotella sp.]MCM1075305.1 hypothetical protein [Ruminococcus sp.]